MRTFTALISAAGFAALAMAGATSASAAPLGAMQKSAGVDTNQVQSIDYRGHRHCHWRKGRKWCHDRYSRYHDGNRYGYGRPGISLRFGWGDRGYRHGRRYWR